MASLVVGERLLAKASIRHAIAERQKTLQQKLHISQERVLEEIAAVCFLDPPRRQVFTFTQFLIG